MPDKKAIRITKYRFVSIVLCLCSSTERVSTGFSPIFRRSNKPITEQSYDYDLVIVGSGASGMFASGAATMLGSKTLLLDVISESTSVNNIGGDCTNTACVPSKSVRSIARMARMDQTSESRLVMARNHATATVATVRLREDPNAIVDRNPNLDIILVNDCCFVSPHQMRLSPRRCYSSARSLPNGTDQIMVRSKKFLIATGASPIIPESIEAAAKHAGLPIYTYRSVYRPSQGEKCKPESIWNLLENNNSTKRVVIAGGGATACEIGQALARLGGSRLEVLLVAPSILPGEDVTLQNAAAQLLVDDGVTLFLGSRVEDILLDRRTKLSGGILLDPADALVLCVGRRPSSLSSLNLEAANVGWDKTLGILVDPRNLQSTTASHVFACGDCSSAVAAKPQSRTAAHAGWTGFQAAMNTKLPRILRFGAKSIHPTVPRVIYTDPELASVGLSLAECIKKYGIDGFERIYLPEEGTDRADMESMERNTKIGFVELRASKYGKILGFTGCGPAASELVNEVSLAIVNGLTVSDMARSMHSYPSHGYLMHRVALGMTLGNIWGVMEACGPVGGVLANMGRFISKLTTKRHFRLKTRLVQRDWEAEGASSSIQLHQSAREKITFPALDTPNDHFQLMSYLDVYNNSTLCEEKVGPTKGVFAANVAENDAESFAAWMSRMPKPRSTTERFVDI
jgi:pyruvate/2-oxoglutarate dehydrogenase complex dihydrolipoamide dehydrogenase (E3) component